MVQEGGRPLFYAISFVAFILVFISIANPQFPWSYAQLSCVQHSQEPPVFKSDTDGIICDPTRKMTLLVGLKYSLICSDESQAHCVRNETLRDCSRPAKVAYALIMISVVAQLISHGFNLVSIMINFAKHVSHRGLLISTFLHCGATLAAVVFWTIKCHENVGDIIMKIDESVESIIADVSYGTYASLPF